MVFKLSTFRNPFYIYLSTKNTYLSALQRILRHVVKHTLSYLLGLLDHTITPMTRVWLRAHPMDLQWQHVAGEDLLWWASCFFGMLAIKYLIEEC